MMRGRFAVRQVLLYLSGQHLAVFDAPLVEGIDIPHHPLHKHLVFIHGHDRPQGSGVQAFEHNGIGGFIALEHFVLDHLLDLLVTLAGGLHFLHRLTVGFAQHQRLGLRQAIGKQHAVVQTQRILAQRGNEEIRRYRLGALVQQLEEGMLTIGARLPQIIGPVR